MPRVGKFVGAVVGSALVGFAATSSAGAASFAIGALNQSALDLLLPSESELLPVGAFWVDGRVAAVNSESKQYRSPWEGDVDEGKAEYWTVGIDNNSDYPGGVGNPNLPNPAVLSLGVGNAAKQLTFLWGSVDGYNIIDFLFNGSVVDSISGQVVVNAGATPGNSGGAAWISIISDAVFDSISFRADGQNAFEFSNIQVSSSSAPQVPLPPAALLLGSVIGGLGLFGMRRRKAEAAA